MPASKMGKGRDVPPFSLVFPTYDPGSVIDRTWAEVTEFLRHADDDWEIVFVCDGCADGTPERLTRWARRDGDRIRILSHTPNQGKGFSVRKGLEAARGQFRLFTDVDLAYRFEDITRLGEVLKAGSPVAIASRLHPDSRLTLPPWLQGYAYRRYLQSLIFSRLVRCILPLGQFDTQAGLKGMSAETASLILPRLRSTGFEFDCEMLTACAALGIPVAEIPVAVRYNDTASTTTMETMGRMVRELWKIRQAWRSGAYSNRSTRPLGVPDPAPRKHAA